MKTSSTVTRKVREHSTILAIVVAAFVAGLVSGSAWTRGADARELAADLAHHSLLAEAAPDAEASAPDERARRGGDHRRGQGQGAGHGWERLQDRLDLTPEQVAAIESIRQEHREELSAHREACRAAAQPHREQMREDIRAVLTEEQRAELDTIHERARERGQRGQMQRGPRGDGERMQRGPRGDGERMQRGPRGGEPAETLPGRGSREERVNDAVRIDPPAERRIDGRGGRDGRGTRGEGQRGRASDEVRRGDGPRRGEGGRGRGTQGSP
ncbi:MAG: hypothetical protein EA398_09190 [Deltaproteobacteria bacterium]|nr:MAG: hypothetical protein EA398_09190 [Deltaproteobacteria bacterium]